MSAALQPRPSLYSTAVGKKYAMAISGIVLMGYVLLHMVGNLKFYFGAESLDTYSEWLREIGEPALPRATMLWAARILLLVAVAVHIHAAYALTRDQPARAAGRVPLQARLRGGRLREPHDALDGRSSWCCSSSSTCST